MRHSQAIGRFPVQPRGASTPWRGAKEVSGVALVVAQEVPTSSSMAVPHGPAGVGQARHRMREQLRSHGVSDSVVDDAVLILSELLSNACRHGRPLGRHTDVGDGDVRAAWRVDRTGGLTVEVTDGGGPTRPVPATPSVTAHGGRGLNIISALAEEWGVRDNSSGEVTVWVLVNEGHGPADERPAARGNARGNGRGPAAAGPSGRGSGVNGAAGLDGLDFAGAFDDVG
ncbi:ATP-binding protein [Streptomyces sp. NBC_01220]|uniref:ATP-binding protein n=1 Tax=unclassified Streptomyces TaxID=2593676 RepID=UPI002E2C12DC|nr:ATP-binding protein [Streptomyces sp. NBC_00184]WSQ45064.1 ATP-binding protein [Streptomyces sp. NBC_01220]